jgi:16S rRNA (cytosine1402-N4)-methyltransferase
VTRHLPVLLPEVLDTLGADRGGVFVDGTFGAGGYTQAILAANRRNRVIAIDRDPEAVAAGASLVAKARGRLTLVPGRAGDLETLVAEAAPEGVDGVVLDIGVA